VRIASFSALAANAPVKWTQATLAKGDQAQEHLRSKMTLARLGPGETGC